MFRCISRFMRLFIPSNSLVLIHWFRPSREIFISRWYKWRYYWYCRKCICYIDLTYLKASKWTVIIILIIVSTTMALFMVAIYTFINNFNMMVLNLKVLQCYDCVSLFLHEIIMKFVVIKYKIDWVNMFWDTGKVNIRMFLFVFTQSSLPTATATTRICPCCLLSPLPLPPYRTPQPLPLNWTLLRPTWP